MDAVRDDQRGIGPLGILGHDGLLFQQGGAFQQPRFTTGAADIKTREALAQNVGIKIALPFR